MNKQADWDYLEARDLPASVKEVASVIGFAETKKLMQELPLTGIYVPKNIDLIAGTALAVLSPEATQKLVNYYGGIEINAFKDRALSRARNRRIRETAKKEIKLYARKAHYYSKIAQEEGLSLGRVRRIIYN